MGAVTLAAAKALQDILAKKLMGKLSERFQAEVLQRWTKPRAEQFFALLCEEVAKEIGNEQNTNVDVLLDMILESDIRTEAMFDAYRRVCLSRSREIGPRLIGLLTAQLIVKNEMADDETERIYMAAEQLNDTDFEQFVEIYEGYENDTNNTEKGFKKPHFTENLSLVVEWHKEVIESAAVNGSRKIQISPLNLGECLGSWGLKLKSLGIVSDDVVQSEHGYSDRDLGTVREVEYIITFSPAALRLKELINRCKNH